MTQLRVECLEDRLTPTLFPTTTPIAGANFANPAVAAVGNFNGDAFPDLAVTNDLSAPGGLQLLNRLTVVLGQANGTFGSPTQVTLSITAAAGRPEGVVAADLDNDGDDDVAAVLNGVPTNNVVVLRNTGTFSGTFQAVQTLTAGANPTHVTAADLNGDGLRDLAVSNFGGTVNVYFNAGNGTFAVGPTLNAGGTGSNVIVATDFDNDGDQDLAVANQQSSNVGLLRNSGGAFAPVGTLAGGDAGTTFLAAGDLDRDGNVDLVASNVFGNTIRMFFGNGNGTFTQETPVPVGTSTTGVVIRDLNGDRMPDVAVLTNPTNGAGATDVRVLANDGGRNFRPPVSFPAVAGATWLAAGDFNADGRPDLVATQYTTGNSVHVLLNGLTPTTTAVAGPATTTAGQSVTYTATVTPAAGGPVTTGFVSFFDGPTFLGTRGVANGTATFTTTALPAGNHAINVSYSDAVDLTWFGSQATLSPATGPGGTGPRATATTGPILAVGGGSGGSAAVFTPAASGRYPAAPTATLAPFPGFGGQVRTATADVDGDGTPDTVLVTGPGTPLRFAVVSGKDNTTLLVPPTAPLAGSEDFTGGGFVAAADLDGDRRAEMVFTPDVSGGPRVTTWGLRADGSAATTRADFFGITGDHDFRGGARVAVGDVDGDGRPDLVVAAGIGGGPRVAIFAGATLLSTADAPPKLVGDFFGFPGDDASRLRNGAFVAAGDVDGDRRADLIFGGGPGGAPRVFILSGAMIAAGNVEGAYAAPVANFFVAGSEVDRGGVRLAAKDADGDGRADVVAGSGDGSPARVRVYLGTDFAGGTAEPAAFQDLTPFGGAALPGGVYVG